MSHVTRLASKRLVYIIILDSNWLNLLYNYKCQQKGTKIT